MRPVVPAASDMALSAWAARWPEGRYELQMILGSRGTYGLHIMIDNNTRRRRKRRMGVRNKLDPALAEALAGDDTGAEWGPAMKALPSDRHRAFVLALYQVPPGYGSYVRAAKLSGFGTSKSSAHSWSAIATRLAHDERILAALYEEDQKRIRAQRAAGGPGVAAPSRDAGCARSLSRESI